MSLRTQVEEAAREVRRLKRAAPYLFPEYGALQQARHEFREASKKLDAARKAWRDIGKGFRP